MDRLDRGGIGEGGEGRERERERGVENRERIARASRGRWIFVEKKEKLLGEGKA